ncbi:MAG: hypothetical protein ABIK89_18995 [Planctomycetota bacterium]
MKNPTKLHRGYVMHEKAGVLLQFPAENAWGFELADDDQTWPGGLGLGNASWEVLADDDPRITQEDRERLGWLLED